MDKQDKSVPQAAPARAYAQQTRRIVAVLLLASAAAAVYLFNGSLAGLFESAPEAPEALARRALKSTPLIDGHNDLPYVARVEHNNRIYNSTTFPFRSGMAHHTDLERIHKGRLGGQFWSLYVDCPAKPENGEPWNREGEYERVWETIEQVDLAKRLISYFDDEMVFVDSPSGVMKAFHAGKLASMMGIEGLHQVGGSIAVLRRLFHMGVRYATLAHNCDNEFADAALGGNRVHHGLSKLGRAAVHEMNRLGMLVDLSHVTEEVMVQAIELSAAPVMFSHSSAYAVNPHPRNVPDAVLKTIPEKDGVVMVNFYPEFIASPPSSATIDTIVEHILHMRSVMGTSRHIGIGSDFDGIDTVPAGMEDVSKYPDLFVKLAEQGLTLDELRGIAGENLLRVWRKVEAVARSMTDELPFEQ